MIAAVFMARKMPTNARKSKGGGLGRPEGQPRYWLWQLPQLLPISSSAAA
jgi:hypothetical protein